MKNLHIREPNDRDTESLGRLMRQLGYPIEHNAMQKIILRYSSLTNQKAWIAEKDGKVVGCIAVAITVCFHREGAFMRVIAMIVDQKFRKGGIGKALMQVAEDYANKMKCSHIELTSGVHREICGSHDFYRKLGYVELNDRKKYFGKKLEAFGSR